jgi:hypothetical protein
MKALGMQDWYSFYTVEQPKARRREAGSSDREYNCRVRSEL